jgi:hypothetical protein
MFRVSRSHEAGTRWYTGGGSSRSQSGLKPHRHFQSIYCRVPSNDHHPDALHGSQSHRNFSAVHMRNPFKTIQRFGDPNGVACSTSIENTVSVTQIIICLPFSSAAQASKHPGQTAHPETAVRNGHGQIGFVWICRCRADVAGIGDSATRHRRHRPKDIVTSAISSPATSAPMSRVFPLIFLMNFHDRIPRELSRGGPRRRPHVIGANVGRHRC